MNCPNCGNIIADGSAMCPICGSSLTQPQGYQQPVYQTAPKKSNTGLIVGITIAALVVIAAIVAVLVLVVFKKDDNDSSSSSGVPNGKYVINSMNLEGQVFSQSDLASIGYGNMSIEINGDSMKFDSTGSGSYANYTYTFSDGKGHVKGNGEEFDFTYSNNTITIDFTSNAQFSAYSTYTMDFVKQ